MENTKIYLGVSREIISAVYLKQTSSIRLLLLAKNAIEGKQPARKIGQENECAKWNN